MGLETNNHDMEEGTLEIGMGKFCTFFYLLYLCSVVRW
jgi:hypothetical protein